MVVRTRGAEPTAIAPDLRAILRQLDRSLTLARVRSMDEIVETHVSQRRFSMLLLTIFGVAALGLAAVGLSAVLAYSVGQRRQEIAIRIAHGATRGDIMRMVLRGGLNMSL